MKLSVISFTKRGRTLSRKIAENFCETDVSLYTKSTFFPETKEKEEGETIAVVDKSLSEWTKEQMEEKNALIFIGACGIAVRAIAPYIIDKIQDSPVLVLDESGSYVIPILSGHLGGANELACSLAKKLGASPVITTATDINRKFAVDMFAKKNDLFIENKDGIAKVSAKVLAGQAITVSIEAGHYEEGYYNEGGILPEGIELTSYPPTQFVDIVITSEEKAFEAAIVLKPKEYVIGMGCRRGKEADKIEAFIIRSLNAIGIMDRQITALVSIDLKKEEEGFLAWSRKKSLPFVTYAAEELQQVEGMFQESVFVKDMVGVDNVCERAAIKAAGTNGKLIYRKHAEDGMTIAIAKREWSVRFDEA